MFWITQSKMSWFLVLDAILSWYMRVAAPGSACPVSTVQYAGDVGMQIAWHETFNECCTELLPLAKEQPGQMRPLRSHSHPSLYLQTMCHPKVQGMLPKCLSSKRHNNMKYYVIVFLLVPWTMCPELPVADLRGGVTGVRPPKRATDCSKNGV